MDLAVIYSHDFNGFTFPINKPMYRALAIGNKKYHVLLERNKNKFNYFINGFHLECRTENLFYNLVALFSYILYESKDERNNEIIKPLFEAGKEVSFNFSANNMDSKLKHLEFIDFLLNFLNLYYGNHGVTKEEADYIRDILLNRQVCLIEGYC